MQDSACYMQGRCDGIDSRRRLAQRNCFACQFTGNAFIALSARDFHLGSYLSTTHICLRPCAAANERLKARSAGHPHTRKCIWMRFGMIADGACLRRPERSGAGASLTWVRRPARFWSLVAAFSSVCVPCCLLATSAPIEHCSVGFARWSVACLGGSLGTRKVGRCFGRRAATSCPSALSAASVDTKWME